jgi:molybdopterin/thiamine biosynthesis adenylyltransferase
MNTLYARNNLYISAAGQDAMRTCRILFAGCGIGSNIAECALRLGFENMTLVDGDKVEETNLNRQNYTCQDLGAYKAQALKNRLLNINQGANIKAQHLYLTGSNMESFIKECDIAINALDFQSDVPFQFDEICQRNNIPVIHPYNIGWATLIFIVTPKGADLKTISQDYKGFEKKVVAFLAGRLKPRSKKWIHEIITDYEKKGNGEPPPQLSIASWLAAGACCNLMYRLANAMPVKQFPDYYFVTTDHN